jgi:inner membrane protein
MDNLTHSLAGWALGQAGLKRKTRKGLAALILGANMPDIDVFFGWVPWEPLATHRGFTHGIVGGVLLMPPILAALLWLLDRWQLRRGAVFKSGLEMHVGWLVALSYIGAATHPLLDWQTSYAIQLFSPFSTRWYHNDSLFIIDVWIWLALGTAVWLSRRREKRGEGGWRTPAIAGTIAVLVYISANGVVSEFASKAPQRGAPYAMPDSVIVSPPPVMFWKRNVIWRQDHAIARGDYDPFHSLTTLQNHTAPIPDGMTDPLVRRALLTTPDLASFRRWSILPMARVTRERCRVLVQFQDARFGNRPGAGALGRSAELPSGAPGCAPGRVG